MLAWHGGETVAATGGDVNDVGSCSLPMVDKNAIKDTDVP